MIERPDRQGRQSSGEADVIVCRRAETRQMVQGGLGRHT
jgi:hypothetical protein